MGIGILKLEFITKPEDLWVPPGSQVVKDRNYFEDRFGAFFRVNQFIIFSKNDGGDVLLGSVMNDLFDLQAALEDVVVYQSGRNWTYHQDFCYKPLHDDNCATQSPLVWFHDYTPPLDDDTVQTHAFICSQSELAVGCYLDDGITQYHKLVLGEPWDTMQDIPYRHAKALMVTYLLVNHQNDNDYIDAAMKWENEFLRIIGDFSDSNPSNSDVAYMAERSVEDELIKEESSDIPVVLISYGMMFLYVSVSLGRIHPTKNKTLLGFLGIIVVILSMVFSVGFNALCGVRASMIISEVIPFLILAIGVDNLFIITNKFERCLKEASSPDEAVPTMLSAVGTSITLSSLCEFLAFMLGAFTDMPAVRSLCLFAGVAVLMDYLLQITLYVGIMLIFERIRQKPSTSISRAFLEAWSFIFYIITVVPWVISFVMAYLRSFRKSSSGSRSKIEAAAEAKTDVENATLRSGVPVGYGSIQEKGAIQTPAVASGDYGGKAAAGSKKDSAPEKPSLASPFPGGVVRPFFEKHYTPFLMHPIVSIVVLLLAVALLGFCLGGFLQLRLGLDQKTALPEDSYVVKYFFAEEKYLEVGPPVYVVVKDPKWDDPSHQTADADMVEEWSALDYVDNMQDWFPSFRAWFTEFKHDIAPDQPIPPENFTDVVKEYLESPCVIQREEYKQHGPCGQYHKDDVVFSSDGTRIVATRLMGATTPLNSQDEFINSYMEAYAETDRFKRLDTFPYSLYYIYFAQYSYIVSVAAANIAIAVSAVFIVCWILLGNLYASFLTIMTVLIVNVDLWGIMGYWGIYVNAVSVVNIVMAVGISVEFCIHIVRAFLIAPSRSGIERTKFALCEIGSSVFSGITLTKFAGVVPLAFAHSQIFVIYYFKMYFSLVLLGAFHGLAFLPCLLSFAGPMPTAQPDEGETAEKSALLSAHKMLGSRDAQATE